MLIDSEILKRELWNFILESSYSRTEEELKKIHVLSEQIEATQQDLEQANALASEQEEADKEILQITPVLFESFLFDGQTLLYPTIEDNAQLTISSDYDDIEYPLDRRITELGVDYTSTGSQYVFDSSNQASFVDKVFSDPSKKETIFKNAVGIVNQGLDISGEFLNLIMDFSPESIKDIKSTILSNRSPEVSILTCLSFAEQFPDFKEDFLNKTKELLDIQPKENLSSILESEGEISLGVYYTIFEAILLTENDELINQTFKLIDENSIELNSIIEKESRLFEIASSKYEHFKEERHYATIDPESLTNREEEYYATIDPESLTNREEEYYATIDPESLTNRQETVYDLPNGRAGSLAHNYSNLHDAAYAQDLEGIEKLIKAGFDKNAVNDKGSNIAHIAALMKNSTLLAQVEEKGVNIHLKNADGVTPIDIARELKVPGFEGRNSAIEEMINAETPEQAERALKKLETINGRYPTQYSNTLINDTPINIAILNNNEFAVRAILANPDFTFKASGELGMNALHAASMMVNNLSDIVFEEFRSSTLPENEKLKIINQANWNGFTPLELAGTQSCAKSLVENGAAPTTSSKKAPDITDYLKTINPASQPEIFDKVENEEHAKIKELPKGFEEFKNRRGENLLEVAARKGNLDLVKRIAKKAPKLISMDLIVNSMDIGFDRKIAENLLKSFEEVNEIDHSKNSLLHHAIEKGREDLALYLIKSPKANINQPNSIEQTPLHLAAKMPDKSASKSIVKALLKASSAEQAINEHDYVSAKDKFGRTALHIAAKTHDSKELVKILMDKKQDPNEIDNFGYTAHDYALDKPKSKKELFLKGATDEDGKSVIDYEIDKIQKTPSKQKYIKNGKKSQKLYEKARNLAKKIYPEKLYPDYYHENSRGKKVFSLLTLAASQGKEETIHKLLKMQYGTSNIEDLKNARAKALEMGYTDLAQKLPIREFENPVYGRQNNARRAAVPNAAYEDAPPPPLYAKPYYYYVTQDPTNGFNNPLHEHVQAQAPEGVKPTDGLSNPLYDALQKQAPEGVKPTDGLSNPLYGAHEQKTPPQNTSESISVDLSKTLVLKDELSQKLKNRYQKFLDNDGEIKELRETSAEFVDELKNNGLLENCGEESKSIDRKTFEINFSEYKNKTVFYPRFNSEGKQLMEKGKPVMDMVQIDGNGEITGATFVGNPKFSTIPDKIYIKAELENRRKIIQKGANVKMVKGMHFGDKTFEEICADYQKKFHPKNKGKSQSITVDGFPPKTTKELKEIKKGLVYDVTKALEKKNFKHAAGRDVGSSQHRK